MVNCYRKWHCHSKNITLCKKEEKQGWPCVCRQSGKKATLSRPLKKFVDIYQMHGVVDLFRRHPRFHHHGSNVQDFSSQLQITSSQNESNGKRTPQTMATPWRLRGFSFVTLHTTLMPSISSAERVLICDVPFRNCSDSDIPVWMTDDRLCGSAPGFARPLTSKVTTCRMGAWRHKSWFLHRSSKTQSSRRYSLFAKSQAYTQHKPCLKVKTKFNQYLVPLLVLLKIHPFFATIEATGGATALSN